MNGLKKRVGNIERAAGAKSREHVVISYQSETEDEAIDLYGREKIGLKDTVLRVVLWGARKSVPSNPGDLA